MNKHNDRMQFLMINCDTDCTTVVVVDNIMVATENGCKNG